MIVKVWGEINGIGAMPTFNIGDKYYFQPPQTLTGRYTCQFWAEDDFGNITNEIAVLTIFEGIVKCIEVLSRVWAVTMLNDPMSAEMEADEWSVKMMPFECRDNMIEVMM